MKGDLDIAKGGRDAANFGVPGNSPSVNTDNEPVEDRDDKDFLKNDL